MSAIRNKKIAKVILFFVLLPTGVIALPILSLGFIFAVVGLYGIASHPLEILGSVSEIIPPKSVIHITPIAVPFGLWGLYTLWAVWDQISQGKSPAELSNACTHLGICAGVTSLTLFQYILHWKALPLYLPLIGVIGYYWLLVGERGKNGAECL